MERLSLVHFVDFTLDVINDPRHCSSMGMNIVEYKTLAFENLYLRWIEVYVLSHKCVVVLAVDFYREFVLGWGKVVSLHLCQR